jgi:uncharacterized membrane protein YgcG
MVPQSKKILLFSLACLFFHACLCVSAWAQDKADINLEVKQARDSGVPEDTLNRILVLGYKQNIEVREMAAFIRIIKQAREEKLPTDLLVNKIEEGFAKGIQPEVIKRVIQQELSRYRFARRILYESMNRWGMPTEDLDIEELARLSKTLSMGISEQEMEKFFASVPQAPVVELVNAVELMASFKQSGLSPGTSEEIALTGLRNRFFSKTPWNLTLMVSTAKKNKISDKKISATVMEIVTGRKRIREAYTDLGLNPQDMAQGSRFSGSQSGVSSKGNGKNDAGDGKGGSNGSNGSNGSGGSGGGKGGGKH